MISLGGTVHAEEEESCVVLGMGLGGLTYQPVQQLAKITNFEYRCFLTVVNIVVFLFALTFTHSSSLSRMQVGEMPWWMKIRPTMRILAQVRASLLKMSFKPE